MRDKPAVSGDCLTYRAIGKRDAVAEILMMVRVMGERTALREIANQLNVACSPTGHCHAKWYLENYQDHGVER